MSREAASGIHRGLAGDRSNGSGCRRPSTPTFCGPSEEFSGQALDNVKNRTETELRRSTVVGIPVSTIKARTP